MEFLKQAKPYLAVIFWQFGDASSAIIAKAALDRGMSHYAFAIYRNLFAAAVFAPFAVFLERKTRPGMTFSILWKILLLGLLGPVLDQNLYYAAMNYTTATFATAMNNMLPAITFVLAWILRLEEVNIRRLPSQVKIGGTIVAVGGATIMTLVSGPPIDLPWTRVDTSVHSSITGHPIKGALLVLGACFSWACFFILQAITVKSYPACLSLMSLICGTGAVQGTILALVVQRGNPAVWSIHFDIMLISYIYSGVIASGLGYYISGLVMKVKGPVFVTAFTPLGMVIVAVLSTLFLAERLNFGRVFGAAVIVVGLYLVIWGKSKDHNVLFLPNNGDKMDPNIGQQLSDKNLTIKSSNDETNDATKVNNAGGDNAV